MDMPILDVRNLYVSYGNNNIIQGLNLSFRKGKSYAILGPSGEGKSTLLKAIDGLIPSSGDIIFNGKSIVSFEEFRSKYVCFLLQDPKNQFNPVYKIGSQLNRAQHIADRKLDRKTRKERTIEALSRSGLDKNAYNLYPHQMSGGMLQRANLAIALLSNKDLILLDEPTLGLDKDLEELLIERLLDIVKENNTTLIFITHSFDIAKKADCIAILKDGKIIEENDSKELISNPRENYTKMLIRANCYA